MPTGIKITSSLEADIVSEYLKAPTAIKTIADKFGLCNPTIIKILNAHNIQRYKKAQVYNPDMNEHYFEIINNEAKAYYIGFIITDGNVFREKINHGRQASISITQSESDEYILEKFKQEINANVSIGHDGRGCANVAVRSDIMAKDLEKYGISPRKTLKTILPTLSEEYMRHMIRGIFDGDGNIMWKINPTTGKYIESLSFCGTHDLMVGIRDYLRDHLHVKNNAVYDYNNRNLSEIKWMNANDIITIGNWMYKDSNVCLIRKKKTFDELCQYYSSRSTENVENNTNEHLLISSTLPHA